MLSKVEKAVEAVANGSRQVALAHHLTNDLEECAFDDEADLWKKLPALMHELKRSNPIQCYAGYYPPQTSVEPELDGLELWAYCWYSGSMNCKMYLKFSLKADSAGRWHYLHARIHPTHV
jgi:hypothetical protein